MTTPVKKLQFNHDNFKKLQLEAEELQDLVIKLSAQLALASAPKEKPKAKSKAKAKE